MNYIEKCEINITRHCNNHCLACNHASPFAPEYYMDPEVLRRDLESFRKVCHIGFLCLQGGEPLLHPKLLELMEIQWSSGIADKCGILSNGRLLSKMPEEFFKQAGKMNLEFRVSAYPTLDQSTLPMQKAQQYGFEIRIGPIHAFWKLFTEQPDGGEAIWKTCYAKTCFTLHEGYFFHCPLAAFFPEQFFGKPFGMSGLPLADITPEKLDAYLKQPEPDWMCAHCTGGSKAQVPWREEFNFDVWKKESTYP